MLPGTPFLAHQASKLMPVDPDAAPGDLLRAALALRNLLDGDVTSPAFVGGLAGHVGRVADLGAVSISGAGQRPAGAGFLDFLDRPSRAGARQPVVPTIVRRRG